MSQSETLRRRCAKWQVDLAIHEALEVADRQAFLRHFQGMLAAVMGRSNLLRVPQHGHLPLRPSVEDVVRAMLALCENRRSWVCDVANWRPSGESRIDQFGSLACHLIGSHPVPKFMTSVWFAGRSNAATRHQRWFKHIARGNSIRGVDIPLALTRPMAGYFLEAPDFLTVLQALRWGQVRGLGGDNRFATSVAVSQLGTTFEQNFDWEPILRFLISRRAIDLNLITPMLDLLHQSRNRICPQAFARISNRAFRAFVNDVKERNRYRSSTAHSLPSGWKSTGIRGFRLVEPQRHQWSMRYWTIEELTNLRALVHEGEALNHCVAAYSEMCENGSTSIWSLQNHGKLTSHRLLTIEVLPKARRIVTALGKYNSPPTSEASRIMEQWAERERLEIALGV